MFQNPEALSSTKLRKHIATMSKILNLSENEADQLADFLGHDIRIHRQFYRLPEGTLQLAKMSKVLMAMEKGTLSEFKGKKLDEIEIDPNGRSIFGFFCVCAVHICKCMSILKIIVIVFLEQLEAQGDEMSSDEEEPRDLPETTTPADMHQPSFCQLQCTPKEQGKKNPRALIIIKMT